MTSVLAEGAGRKLQRSRRYSSFKALNRKIKVISRSDIGPFFEIAYFVYMRFENSSNLSLSARESVALKLPSFDFRNFAIPHLVCITRLEEVM